MTHRFSRFLQPLTLSKSRLTVTAFLVGVLAPSAALAVQGAELYHSETYRYGRFEARVRFAPGEGVVSSFFLWKDRPNNSGPWNELDFEKINSDCRMQTNIWTGTGTESPVTTTPSPNICNDYHTYAIEWTPDYIAWFIDGKQLRRVTGAPVTEYTQNATPGMAIHFNIWQGDSNFGGNLNTSTLPIYQYISWVQYSSYANGGFQMQWRESFSGSTAPSGWLLGDWTAPLNHSTHNMANVKFVNGIAVLALTNDNATGYTGTPPADSGDAGSYGGGGAGGAGGGGGAGGTGTGSAGRGGAGGTGGSAAGGTGGTSSTGRGGNAGGTAGNGAGGNATGTAGSGVGGTTGSAGSGAGGTTGAAGSSAGGTTGTAGSSAGGTTGTAGSGAGGGTTGAAGTSGGPTGSAGTVGTGGASAGSSGGTTTTGGTPGSGGSTSGTGGSTTDPDGGCGCRASGDGSARDGGLVAVLLIAAGALRRRRRITRSPARS